MVVSVCVAFKRSAWYFYTKAPLLLHCVQQVLCAAHQGSVQYMIRCCCAKGLCYQISQVCEEWKKLVRFCSTNLLVYNGKLGMSFSRH